MVLVKDHKISFGENMVARQPAGIRMTNKPVLTRRQMMAMTATALCAPYVTTRGARQEGGARLEGIEPKGSLVQESTMEGHRLADNVVPAHPNGWQLSRNRWMIFYSTRSFRGIDDDWSMVYQLRKDAPDGPVIREGFFKRTQMGWDPIGDGTTPCAMQHSHPVVFGVPRGAVLEGKPAPNANVFAASWRRKAVHWIAATNQIEHPTLPSDPPSEYVSRHPALNTPSHQFLCVEWVQFRLNAREDDIEIIAPVTILRQQGFETGERYCNASVRSMNAGFVTPVPFNRECTEWIGVNHFDGGRVAFCKYTFDAKRGRYVWSHMGPLLGSSDLPLMEGFVARFHDDWIIGARRQGGSGAVWGRTADPFGHAPALKLIQTPGTTTPRTAYMCPDGVLRIFTGDLGVSYYGNARDPLYSWDVDPDNQFAVSNRRVVIDLRKFGLPMRPEIQPWADNCKLLPPQGRHQILVYRVHASANDRARPTVAAFWKNNPKIIPSINGQEKAACGCYYSVITYSEEVPPMWRFA